MKKTIILLSESRAQNTAALLTPLRLLKNELKQHGVTIRRVPFMHPLFFWGADEVWINSKNFRTLWGRKEHKIKKFFDHFRKKNIPVKYFDTTDSAGAIQQGALSHVKYYYKFFLYKNRAHYLERLYGNRLFTDYYHRKFGVTDNGQSENVFKALTEDEVQKLKVFWGPSGMYLNSSIPAKEIKEKTVPFSSRFHQSYGRPTVAFQRIESAKILESKGFPTGRVEKEEFLKELSQSKISYSPFGWGEFAFRDYEIICNETLLIKPDMKEIETWPSIYREDTYIPVDWSLSDLSEKIDFYVNNKEKTEVIAKTAARMFEKQHYGEQALKDFLERILSVVRD